MARAVRTGRSELRTTTSYTYIVLRNGDLGRANLLQWLRFVCSEYRCDRASAKVAGNFAAQKGHGSRRWKTAFSSIRSSIRPTNTRPSTGNWMRAVSRPNGPCESRRTAQFITPIPKPRKRKESPIQEGLEFDDEAGLSTGKQRYEPIPIINELRQQVDEWRRLPSPNDWLVTPETARLLQHWRHHQFQGIRPFFCQIEAVESRNLADRGCAEAPGGEEVSGAFGQCQCRGES